MAKDKSIPSNIVLAKEKFKYDTIQDMVNDITLKVGMVVDINGYYKPDDGATHKRVIADTDDGSGVQLRSGKWANIVHNGEVNVSWFGAKGDGVTDDVAYVEKSIKYANTYSDNQKNFYLTKSIIELNHSIRNMNFKVELNTYLHFSNTDNIKIQSNKFERIGEITDPQDRGQFLITLEKCKNAEISNNTFKNAVSNICLNLCSQIDVKKNYFYDSYQSLTTTNGYGIVLHGSNYINIYKNEFTDVQRHSVYVSVYNFEDPNVYTYCNNIDIFDNIFKITKKIKGWNNTGFEQQVKYISAKNCRCYNNTFIDCVGAVLFDETGTELGKSNIESIYIYNNTLINCTNPKRESGLSGILLTIPYLPDFLNQNPNNIVVSGNKIFNSNTMSNHIISIGRGDKIIVENNIVVLEDKTVSSFCTVYTAQKNPFKTGRIDIVKNILHNARLFTMDSLNDIEEIKLIGNINESKNNDFSSIMFPADEGNISSIEIFGNTMQGFQRPIYIKKRNIPNGIIIHDNDLRGGQLDLGDNETYDGDIEFYNNKNYIFNKSEITLFSKENDEFKNENVNYQVNHSAIISTEYFKKGKFGNGNILYLTNENKPVFYNNGSWYFADGTLKGSMNPMQLNTPYHVEKMQQEGVYNDFITYMDEKTLYDKQQRKLEQDRQLAYEEALKENPELTYEEFMSVQPMTLNLVEEPQPSENLKKFMDKYL